MTGTNLVPSSYDPNTWSVIKEQSAALEAAGKGTSILPSGITNRYQISAVLLKGQELGFAPLYSLEQIVLIKGKPIIQGQGLSALIKARHGPDAIRQIESTEEVCTLEFSRPDGANKEIHSFTIEEAKRAGLTGKDVWKSYPKDMLRWRCIARGAKSFFPDTIAGLRLADDVGMAMNQHGEFIEGELASIEGEVVKLTEVPVAIEEAPSPTSVASAPAQEPLFDGAPPPPVRPDLVAQREAAKALLNRLQDVKGGVAEAHLKRLVTELGFAVKSAGQLDAGQWAAIELAAQAELDALATPDVAPVAESADADAMEF